MEKLTAFVENNSWIHNLTFLKEKPGHWLGKDQETQSGDIWSDPDVTDYPKPWITLSLSYQ